jgi:hypothetical protein
MGAGVLRVGFPLTPRYVDPRPRPGATIRNPGLARFSIGAQSHQLINILPAGLNAASNLYFGTSLSPLSAEILKLNEPSFLKPKFAI